MRGLSQTTSTIETYGKKKKGMAWYYWVLIYLAIAIVLHAGKLFFSTYSLNFDAL